MDFQILSTWGFDIDGRDRRFNYKAIALTEGWCRRAVYFYYDGHLDELTYSCTDNQWEEIWRYLPKSEKDLQTKRIKMIQGHQYADVFIDWEGGRSGGTTPLISEDCSICNRCGYVVPLYQLHSFSSSNKKDRIRALQSRFVVCSRCIEKLGWR